MFSYEIWNESDPIYATFKEAENAAMDELYNKENPESGPCTIYEYGLDAEGNEVRVKEMVINLEYDAPIDEAREWGAR